MAKHQIALAPALKAIANERRLQILEWLKDPRAHFRPQVDGDLVEDGVCGVLIAEEVGVSVAALSEHMRVLVSSGLLKSRRIKGWTMYRRDEKAIAAARKSIQTTL